MSLFYIRAFICKVVRALLGTLRLNLPKGLGPSDKNAAVLLSVVHYRSLTRSQTGLAAAPVSCTSITDMSTGSFIPPATSRIVTRKCRPLLVGGALCVTELHGGRLGEFAQPMLFDGLKLLADHGRGARVFRFKSIYTLVEIPFILRDSI